MNRFWPSQRRGIHNDIVGWQVGVLGTTYAVVIGFMLYTVWTEFTAADINADAEASSLVNVSRLASGLPSQQRDEIQSIARQYADVMISKEWPAMNRGELSPESHVLFQQLWRAVVNPARLDTFQQTCLDHTMYELSELSEHRRLRQIQSESKLPPVLWAVLDVGALVVIGSSCLFGTENKPLHYLQVLVLSLLLGLSLVAIADIDRPFQGAVHVKTTAFDRARQSLNEGIGVP